MVVSYLVDRALWQCFRPQLYQTKKTWFCVQVSLRSRRLEVAGERENGRARGRHYFHYFQAPATQAMSKFAQRIEK